MSIGLEIKVERNPQLVSFIYVAGPDKLTKVRWSGSGNLQLYLAERDMKFNVVVELMTARCSSCTPVCRTATGTVNLVR